MNRNYIRGKGIKIFLLAALIGAVFLFNKCDFFHKTKKVKVVNVDLNKILKRGKLIAITGYNAYSYFIYKGQPMGYEYDLLQLLGKDLGIKVQLKVVASMDTMFKMLNDGQGDLIAYNLTVTRNRMKRVAFTHYLTTTKQVLVQRKPKNWRRMTVDQIERSLIRSPINLENKTVYVVSASAYISRLKNLSNEIGGKINMVIAKPDLNTQDLIRMVVEGKIDYTVSDKNIAQLSQAYYSNIDINTDISLPQKIAWAVRKNAAHLLDTVNYWIDHIRRKAIYYVIYNKYYKNRTAYRRRRISPYFSLGGGKISRYDNLIKKYSKVLHWDWRLLASMIYQESQFNPDAISWAGAEGLMQIMPATATMYKINNPKDPTESIKAGVKYLIWLNKLWKKYVKDPKERIKFVLASYNIGYGHVLDAMRLAKKYGADPTIWFNNVEKYLRLKSEKKYYTDKVVRNGYCNGLETVNYVREILERYKHYKQFIPLNKSIPAAKLISQKAELKFISGELF